MAGTVDAAERFDDQGLLARLRAGDEKTFTTLVDGWSGWMLRLARARMETYFDTVPRCRQRGAPMTCEELVELVTAYLEGTLPDDQRQTFDEHLDLCPGCDHYLAQFRTTIGLLGQLPPESITPPARQRLLDAFAEWRRTSDDDGS